MKSTGTLEELRETKRQLQKQLREMQEEYQEKPNHWLLKRMAMARKSISREQAKISKRVQRR